MRQIFYPTYSSHYAYESIESIYFHSSYSYFLLVIIIICFFSSSSSSSSFFALRFGDIIDTVPRMAAVLYNDSCYIAHNCTLITHTYKEDLGEIDASLQDNSGFIDFILKFR